MRRKLATLAEPEEVILSVRVPEPLRGALKLLALSRKTTMSALVIETLRREVAMADHRGA